MYGGETAMPSISADEKRWRAEEDARTLAEAERIRIDSKRMVNAKQAATRIANEEAKRAEAMKKVAAGKAGRTVKEPAKKGSVSKSKIKKAVKNVKSGHNVFQRI